MQVACLSGLVEAKIANATAVGKPTNFDDWIMRVMGRGIADLFMRPYNFKVNKPGPWVQWVLGVVGFSTAGRVKHAHHDQLHDAVELVGYV